MVFGQKTVSELKTSASRVLEAIIENKNLRSISTAFSDLNQLWESPAIVLFRRNYGNAAVSMPKGEHLKNWKNVLDGINFSKINERFMHYGHGTDRLLVSMSCFYTSLSVMESAHIDDINKHYANK